LRCARACHGMKGPTSLSTRRRIGELVREASIIPISPPHRGADPVDEWRPAFTRQSLDEAADRPRLDRLRHERDQGRRIGEIEREAVVLFVYQPLAGPAPDHIHGNDAAILGELRGEHVEVAAVARQPMHADDGMVLAGVAPFVVGDAMESMWVEGEKGVLTRFGRHSQLALVVAGPGTNLARRRLRAS
jgi:hypothetical protein